MVFFGRRIVEHAGCVRVDTADGIRQSVDHLVERGRKHPGLVVWNAADQRSVYRREGYLTALAAHGLPIEERRIWAAETGPEDPSADTLDRAIDTVVGQLGADSLIIDDDVWAVRFIQRLKDRGFRVPDDVAVVGYDNLDMGTVVDPPLTTIDQDHDACARAMLDLLLSTVEGETPAASEREIVVKPRLIVRKST
jgi:DNA-binding LacI/PurR family transcriptional regulator